MKKFFEILEQIAFMILFFCLISIPVLLIALIWSYIEPSFFGKIILTDFILIGVLSFTLTQLNN